ncbi:TetR/AcrR family transcriptional regulator [Clostridium sp. AF37-5]|jgi:AcrR family transcriptional regulator|nr:TetR/AcrR family transcriptional regulator [Clostridium sp. AF37-5]
MMKNKQETIEKIKQAALEEFYANGYAKASLRTICCRAGVTKDSESVLKK